MVKALQEVELIFHLTYLLHSVLMHGMWVFILYFQLINLINCFNKRIIKWLINCSLQTIYILYLFAITISGVGFVALDLVAD